MPTAVSSEKFNIINKNNMVLTSAVFFFTFCNFINVEKSALLVNVSFSTFPFSSPFEESKEWDDMLHKTDPGFIESGAKAPLVNMTDSELTELSRHENTKMSKKPG